MKNQGINRRGILKIKNLTLRETIMIYGNKCVRKTSQDLTIDYSIWSDLADGGSNEEDRAIVVKGMGEKSFWRTLTTLFYLFFRYKLLLI